MFLSFVLVEFRDGKPIAEEYVLWHGGDHPGLRSVCCQASRRVVTGWRG
jgi:hypothetical protein